MNWNIYQWKIAQDFYNNQALDKLDLDFESIIKRVEERFKDLQALKYSQYENVQMVLTSEEIKAIEDIAHYWRSNRDDQPWYKEFQDVENLLENQGE